MLFPECHTDGNVQNVAISDGLVSFNNMYTRFTRDLFKKIRDTKGTFHAKMGSTKDRNNMDLTEAEGLIIFTTQKIFISYLSRLSSCSLSA